MPTGGRRTSTTYPGGTNQVTYGYDAANRLVSVTDWNLAAVGYAYDDAGRMTAKSLPGSTGIVSAYTYDNANRLLGIAHVQNGQTTIASVAYTLDAVGNRTQRVDQQGTHTYAYDNVYRLTSVTYPGPSTTGYTFDAFGNRTSMTTGAGTTTYTYDDADRLTSVLSPQPSVLTYTWDNNGNLTNRGADTFAWDYEDRMVSATVNGTTSTFTYRGDGLRDSRTVGGNSTLFTWDINAGLPVVLDDGNQYVYGAGLESMVTAGGTYYYLADGLGSTMAMVDSAGAVQKSYTYDVYGKPTATGSLANEFDFAGQQTDPTGLQYLRARYMDPDTGTFLSRDPLAAAPVWMGQLYGYVDSDPVDAVDPLGLFSLVPPGAVDGCIFGFGPGCKEKGPTCHGEPIGSAPCLGPYDEPTIVALNSCQIDCVIYIVGEYRRPDGHKYQYRIKVHKPYRSVFEAQAWTGSEVAQTMLSKTTYKQANGLKAQVKEIDGLYYVLVQSEKYGIVGARRGLTRSELRQVAEEFGWIGFKP